MTALFLIAAVVAGVGVMLVAISIRERRHVRQRAPWRRAAAVAPRPPDDAAAGAPFERKE